MKYFVTNLLSYCSSVIIIHYLNEASSCADKEGSTYDQSLASGTETSLSVVGSIMKTAETDMLSGGKTEDILSLSFKDEDDSVSRGLSIIKETNVI